MKLGSSQIQSSSAIVIADFYPFKAIGGHITANLQKENNIQIVVGEMDTNGKLIKAIALALDQVRDMSSATATITANEALYSSQLG